MENIPAKSPQQVSKEDLIKLIPALKNAIDSCDAGKIASEVLGNVFKTEIISGVLA